MQLIKPEELITIKLKDLIYSHEDGVGLITINRPEVLNAFRINTWLEFSAILNEIKKDSSIRCLLVTGAGKAFSAGQDINELEELIGVKADYSLVRQNIEVMQNITREIVNLPIPVVSAVNGYAVGAGAEVAIASDIRYASEHASFEFAEVKIGLFETNGVTFLLPRLIGFGRAKELLLTGRKIDAREAKQIGLVSKVYSAGELLDQSMDRAREIAANAPIPVRKVKHVLNRTAEIGLEETLTLETDAVMHCCFSDDVREGASAFFEKRKPSFKGR